MPIHDIQSSFAGGEAAPDLQARVDIQKYKTFAKTLRNMVSSPHGPAYNRPGTKFVQKALVNGLGGYYKGRLLPFTASDGTEVVIEISGASVSDAANGAFRFYENGVYVGSGDVTHSYDQNALGMMRFAQSGDTLYIACDGYKPATLVRNSQTSWTLTDYAPVDGPFQIANSDSTHVMAVHVVTGVSHMLASIDVYGGTAFSYFTSDMVGAKFRLNYAVPSANVTADITTTGAQSALYCGGTWRLVTTGTWVGTLVVEKSTDGGTTYTTLQTFTANGDLNINTYGTEDTGSAADPYADYFLIRVNATALTSGTCHMSFSRDSFSHSGMATIASYVSSSDVTVTIDRVCLTPDMYSTWGIANIATSDWAEGSWSDLRGWPRTICFFQDRLVWGGTHTEPQTIWTTRTGDYTHFGISNPLRDDDAISVNLQSRNNNIIKALVPMLQSIVVFTNKSEWSLSSTSGGPITPTTVFQKLQGNRGTGDVTPIVIGRQILFIEPRGSCVRELTYEFFTDTFTSENISTLSDHLFKNHTIVDMFYQQEPDSIVWFVRDDGVLLSLTYLKEQQVLAWNRHDTYDGAHTFESVCATPGTGADEVWFVVKRGSFRSIERMLLRTQSTDPADQYFVDCGFTYDSTAVISVSGHDELTGFTVAVNAEGFVLERQAVSGGVVKFDTSRKKAQVGLPFTSDIELLDPDFPTQNGTSQGRKYRISRTAIRFLNTVGGSVGPDLSTLDKLNGLYGQSGFRSGALADATPTPLYTGYLTPTLRPSSDYRGHVAYRQSDPMPVTIMAVLPIITPGEGV